ncbi:MAG: hypothetical protein ACREN8_00805, partial [Candidatus Dormibacteraceae bacterium]
MAYIKFPDRAAATRRIISVDGEGKNLPVTPGTACANPYVFDSLPDGNGGTAPRGWHSYTMIAASDDQGHRRNIVHNGSRREANTSHPDPDNHIARNYGLPTVDCLEFLLNLHHKPKDAIVVAFYFSYDVGKILADLPVKRLRDIACADIPENYHERMAYLRRRFNLTDSVIKRSGSNGKGLIAGESTIWGNYYIAYTPRKKFHVIDLAAGRILDPYDPKGKRMIWAREVIVWDVFGFYQSSFVVALDGARTSAGERLCPAEVIDRIKGMKDQRGEFANLTDDAILTYCYEEVHYLTAMFRNTLTHVEAMGLKLTRFDGSGALAAAWLNSRDIKEYKQVAYSGGAYWGNRPGCLPEDAALAGYYGGRFEVSELGPMGDMFAYDINSAYPAIMATLPCLAHGTWERVTDYVPGEWGIYLAGSLTDPDKHAERLVDGFDPGFAPFPFRPDQELARACGMAEHSVMYAHGGRRWVWQDELGVARSHYGADAIPVHDGWVWRQECEHKPFAEIPDMFLTRRDLKRKGDGAEKTYKLAYNSFYGKLAQSVGWAADVDKGITPPQFQSYIWAGIITSGTRAMILDAVCQSGADVTSIATDGILSRSPIDHLTCSAELGEWEYSAVTDAYLFQSGVYTMIAHDETCTDPETHIDTEHEKCKRKYATRGFSSKEIGYQQLIDAWTNGVIKVSPIHDADNVPTRFVNMRQGVSRLNALDVIGQWIPSVHD